MRRRRARTSRAPDTRTSGTARRRPLCVCESSPAPRALARGAPDLLLLALNVAVRERLRGPVIGGGRAAAPQELADGAPDGGDGAARSEEHTSELQSQSN